MFFKCLLCLCVIYCLGQSSLASTVPKLVSLVSRIQDEGSLLHVTCTIKQGIPPLFFEWFKNGRPLKSNPNINYKIESSEMLSTLTIQSLRQTDSGNYTCSVNNQIGADSQSFSLLINVPPYLTTSVLIPILVAVVIIVIACSAAYVYIKIEETNAHLIKAGVLSVSPSKNFQYIDTSMTPQMSARTSVVSEEGSLAFRYSDSSDKTKPLLARPGQPAMLWTHETIAEESDEASYASLPFQKQQNHQQSHHQPALTSFRELPSLPPPLPPDNRPLAYDEKGLLCHTPPHTSSGSVFCKVDVHHNDNSDSYDEFFGKPQHV